MFIPSYTFIRYPRVAPQIKALDNLAEMIRVLPSDKGTHYLKGELKRMIFLIFSILVPTFL